ncbi:MAG: zf-HC2 domain-containing protein [Geodermatophilaceae bacterium]|nr:zf-HC2 domain-containing protein [Geodermatophilaceae bacterium]
MTSTEFHLALEAVVAYVDGELSTAADTRAAAHVASCAQCAADVADQRAAKRVLVTAGGPELPSSLLDRLQQIPFTTQLQPPGMQLAMHGEQLLWSRTEAPASRAPGRSAPVSAAPAGPAPPDRRVAGHPEAPRRPQNRRPGRSSSRLRRLRRGLAGAVAGLAAGVLATSAVPVAVSGAGTAQPRTVQERTVVPNTSTALFRSLDDAMAPREFSGAATGLR